LGKLSAIVLLSKLSMSVLDRATEHEDAPSAARADHPLERARRARYVLYARAMAAAPKQTAAANVKLNRIVRMSRSSGHRRERDRSLWHRRLCRLCVMADDSATVRLIRAIVQAIRSFILDHIARLKLLREPRTVPIFDLDRAPSGCLPRGNADFG